MPFYLFESKKTGEIKEFFFHMNDVKEVKGYTRVFTLPQAQIDTQVDPNSYKEFSEKICNKKNIKMGDLWAASQEMSEKRAKYDGIDRIKEKSIKDYEKRCKKKHPEKAKLPKKIEI